IGTITPAAPASSARMRVAGSFHAARTSTGTPVPDAAWRMRTAAAWSTSPCCMSMHSESKPERAAISAGNASGMANQALVVVVPERQRDLREVRAVSMSRSRLTSRAVGKHDDAVPQVLGAVQLQEDLLGEERPPAPQGNGMHHQPVLVDESQAGQSLHDADAAVQVDARDRLLFQPLDLVAFDAARDTCALPVGHFEGRREDDLAHGVEVRADGPVDRGGVGVACRGRPVRCVTLIGLAAHQEGVGVTLSLDHVVGALVAHDYPVQAAVAAGYEAVEGGGEYHVEIGHGPTPLVSPEWGMDRLGCKSRWRSKRLFGAPNR